MTRPVTYPEEMCSSPTGCDDPTGCWNASRCVKRICDVCDRRIATNIRPVASRGGLYHRSCWAAITAEAAS